MEPEEIESADWSVLGPLIEEYEINLECEEGHDGHKFRATWRAWVEDYLPPRPEDLAAGYSGHWGERVAAGEATAPAAVRALLLLLHQAEELKGQQYAWLKVEEGK